MLSVSVYGAGCGGAPVEGRVPGAANTTIRELSADDSGAWSVVVLADIQEGFTYIGSIFDEIAGARPTAVIIAGDLARGAGGQHLALLVQQLQQHPSPAPLFVVPGNHDCLSPAAHRAFLERFGSTEFEFRIGKFRFLGLDSMTRPISWQLDRLHSSTELASARGEQLIVVRHHPVSGGNGSSADEPAREDNRMLLQALQSPPVTLVISGHSHESSVEAYRGMTLVVAAPSGDRNMGGGQTPVSYLVLRWNGSKMTLEQHKLSRTNSLDLEAAYLHVMIAHIRPLLRERPLGAASVGVVFAICAGLGTWSRRRRRQRT